jgi:hypothetical protein
MQRIPHAPWIGNDLCFCSGVVFMSARRTGNNNSSHVNLNKMAKQIGILPIEGSLNNMTFYKAVNGIFVRTQSKVSKDKIMSSESFRLTWQNMSAFATTAKGGHFLYAIIPIQLSSLPLLLQVLAALRAFCAIGRRG